MEPQSLKNTGSPQWQQGICSDVGTLHSFASGSEVRYWFDEPILHAYWFNEQMLHAYWFNETMLHVYWFNETMLHAYWFN